MVTLGGRRPLDAILLISFVILIFEFVLVVNSSVMLNYNLNKMEDSKSIFYTIESPSSNLSSSDYANNTNSANYSDITKVDILDEFDGSINGTYKNLPKNYYEIADKIYPKVKHENISTLYHILLTIKLPPYSKNYDCSDSSAQLEWILEGYGFKAYLATSPYPPPGSNGTTGHMWVMVRLENGNMVAIESTLLTKNNYHPPGIIMGKDRKYLKYSYMYHDYITYLKKYSNKKYGKYALPKNFTDFIEHYYVPPITDCKLDLMAHYYYNPPILCDSPEDYVTGIKKGNKIYYIPISQFDWWDNPYNKYIYSHKKLD